MAGFDERNTRKCGGKSSKRRTRSSNCEEATMLQMRSNRKAVCRNRSVCSRRSS
jgi:hypothetical protein